MKACTEFSRKHLCSNSQNFGTRSFCQEIQYFSNPQMETEYLLHISHEYLPRSSREIQANPRNSKILAKYQIDVTVQISNVLLSQTPLYTNSLHLKKSKRSCQIFHDVSVIVCVKFFAMNKRLAGH